VIKPASYRMRPWPKLRDALVTFLEAHRPHTIYAFTEADVTDALLAIERLRRDSRIAVSFHAYVLHCLAQAAHAHPEVLAYRMGRRIVTFDDVDIGTAIDRRQPDGTRFPVAYVLRGAQVKSLACINWELREVARRDLADDETVRLRRRVMALPALVRRLMRWQITRNPFWMRRFFGTIGCTNVRVTGSERPGFVLPPNVFTVTVGVGWITERPVAGADGALKQRRMLCLACGFDHAVVDGIPVARWAQSFIERLEGAAGLDESLVAETRALRGRAREQSS
jgi:pyruvate/2-oxoglutarate dehydrogenase complex dihydrolipoamide acyltransferase (E2) component